MAFVKKNLTEKETDLYYKMLQIERENGIIVVPKELAPMANKVLAKLKRGGKLAYKGIPI